MLMTFPGIPGLYYGDEIGMVDVAGLGARGCMIWDEARQDRALLDYHRRLITLRRRSSALQRGGFQVLAAEAETVAFQRESENERVIVIAHRGATARAAGPLPVTAAGVTDGARFVDAISGAAFVVQDGALALPSLGQGALVLEER